MKTRTINILTFDELAPKARERAIDQHRTFLGKQWDGDTVIEDAKHILAFAGFDIERVGYSGFWSQGDGAHFEGSWSAAKVNAAGMRAEAPVDAELHRIADALAAIAKSFPGATLTVKHSGRYQHQYCTDFTVEFTEADLSDSGPYATGDDIEAARGSEMTVRELRGLRAVEDRDAAEKALIELARSAMRWIYEQLEREYDYQTDEAQVVESIRANEYEFTEDGEIA